MQEANATDQIVELRVHGVSGTPPEYMLGDPHPYQVSGDSEGRVLRARHPKGSPLSPPGANNERVIEGFHWGRFTAGSATRALWLLLLPFALVNLARFALLLPHKDVDRRWTHRWSEGILRLLGHVLTLMLITTACYIVFDLVALQCGGDEADCEVNTSWLAWFAPRDPAVRFLVAALVPAGLLLLISLLGRATFLYPPPGGTKKWRTETGSFDDPAFWQGARNVPTQRAGHVMAGAAILGLSALVTLGSPIDRFDRFGWLAAAAYVVFGLGCVAFLVTSMIVVIRNKGPLDDPSGEPDPQPAKPRASVHVSRLIAVGLAAGCVVFTAFQLPDGRVEGGTGIAIIANALTALTATLLVALLCLSIGIAGSGTGRRTRGAEEWMPRAFSAYWGGLGGWMLAALGAILGYGFSTAAVFWVAGLIGTPTYSGTGLVGLPPEIESEATADKSSVGDSPLTMSADVEVMINVAAGYWVGALLWGTLAIVAVAIIAPMVCWLLESKWRALSAGALMIASAAVTVTAIRSYDGDDLLDDRIWWFLGSAGLAAGAVLLCVFAAAAQGFAKLVGQDYASKDAPDDRLLKPITRAWRVTASRFRYHHALGALVAAGGMLVVLVGIDAVLAMLGMPDRFVTRQADGWLGDLGIVVVTGIAVGLVGLGIATWRKPALRTTVGIIWDLVSFWPRLVHPLCPPPYGGRAVLGVASRVEELVGKRGARAVVLSGHSQGAVITTSAVALIGQRRRENGPGLTDSGTTPEQVSNALAMLTYGSQLQFIYARLFPTYLGFRRLEWIYRDELAGRWRHLYRWTDPLGGPVLSWPAKKQTGPKNGPGVARWSTMVCVASKSGLPPQVSPVGEPGQLRCWPVEGACEGHFPALREAGEGHGITWRWYAIGPDLRLRDPDLIDDNAYYPRSPIGGHSGYPSDPVLDRVVVELAAQTLADSAPPPQPGG